jgi:phasin family protein
MTQLNAQLTEQFSAVRNIQLEAQLDVFRALATRALDNAGQLFALNLKASRRSVEQATGAVRQLLDARDPRDLLALGTATQDQWQQLFSYGREVFGIATGAPALNWIANPASASKLPAPQLSAPAPAPASASAPAARIAEPVDADAVAEAVAEAEAAAETAIADEVPPLAANPVAEAFQEIAPLPASAEHPIAAPVHLDAHVELPTVDPVDNAPPVHAASAAAPAPAPVPKAARGSRRK